MNDLIDRLRALSRGEHSDFSLGGEAADEIIDLQQRLADAEILAHENAEKALAYDLDQAGITARDAEAAELVSLRAEVAHHRSQLKRIVQIVSESVALWLEEQAELEERNRKSMQHRSSKVLSEERAIVLDWAADEIRDGAHLRASEGVLGGGRRVTTGMTREEWQAMKDTEPKPDARIIPTEYIGNQIAAEIGQMSDEEIEANVLRFFPPRKGVPADGGEDEIDGLLDLVRRIKAEVDGVRQEAAVDGPTYNAGRLEGHADIAARLRAILDPEDENHWNIDGVLEAVEDNAKMLEAMRKELNALCDWGDDSFLHAYCHIGNVIKNLRADVRTERMLREKAEANYAFMVKKAADQSLDGYRELGARCAQLEAERDKARAKLRGYETAPVHVAADVLRSRLRETAQILIEAVGADGPMGAEDAARKAAEVIEHHRECMRQAGLQAFMRGRSPEEVGDHLRGVLKSYTDKIEELEKQDD